MSQLTKNRGRDGPLESYADVDAEHWASFISSDPNPCAVAAGSTGFDVSGVQEVLGKQTGKTVSFPGLVNYYAANVIFGAHVHA